MTDSANLINIKDYHREAKQRLSQMAYGYYAAGAHDELTLADNEAAYSRIKLRYRVLRGLSERSMETTFQDCAAAMPAMIAPTAFHGLATPEAELATARAAAQAGIPMMLSMLANTRLEDVAAAASTPLMMQLYLYRDRQCSAQVVQRAEQAGYKAIALTVDAPMLGTRERDVRNNFQLPQNLSIGNMSVAQLEKMGKDTGSGLGNYFAAEMDPSISWKDVDWLRSITRLPILIKGIVHPEDARIALDNGAAGVIVSNHGARQLDTSPATIDALPAVAEAMDGKGTLLMDGGIRRGTDILKALALGAEAVLIGRPVLWGLAVDGENGAARVLQLLRDELSKAMTLAGFGTVSDLRQNGHQVIFRSPQ